MADARTSIDAPEFVLLRQCCAAGFDDRRLIEVAKLAQSIDAQQFARLAQRHRVELLALNALSRAGVSLFPESTDPLRASAAQSQATNLRSATAIAKLASCASQVGLDFLLIKGLATGAIAYTNPAVKSGRDIDILVRNEDVSLAVATLWKLGYSLEIPRTRPEQWHQRNKESVWTGSDGLVLELHTRLADNRDLIPQLDMNSRRQPLEIGGAIVETFALAELIAYSAVHGSACLWFRLKWLADFAALLWAQHREGLADRSYQSSVDLGAGRMAKLAFALAKDLFDVSLSPELIDTLNNDVATTLSRRQSIAMLEREEPTKRRFGTLGLRSGQLLLMPDLAGAAAEAVRQVEEVVRNRL